MIFNRYKERGAGQQKDLIGLQSCMINYAASLVIYAVVYKSSYNEIFLDLLRHAKTNIQETSIKIVSVLHECVYDFCINCALKHSWQHHCIKQ